MWDEKIYIDRGPFLDLSIKVLACEKCALEIGKKPNVKAGVPIDNVATNELDKQELYREWATMPLDVDILQIITGYQEQLTMLNMQQPC
jgi:hypothetical protein